MGAGRTELNPLLQVLNPGMGLSVQDLGRPRLKMLGVPPGGPMDRRSAWWANRLVGNATSVPLLEILPHGFSIKALQTLTVALCGAEVECSPCWRSVELEEGAVLAVKGTMRGVWLYMAVAGGIEVPRILGSASPLPGFPTHFKPGSIFYGNGPRLSMDGSIAGRFAKPEERPDFPGTAILNIHEGPQWSLFSPTQQDAFLKNRWKVSARSSRVGYRLEGNGLAHDIPELASEPARLGSVQLTPDGTAVALMRDGPTIGGYPKIAILASTSIDTLAQCRAGTDVEWRMEPIIR